MRAIRQGDKVRGEYRGLEFCEIAQVKQDYVYVANGVFIGNNYRDEFSATRGVVVRRVTAQDPAVVGSVVQYPNDSKYVLTKVGWVSCNTGRLAKLVNDRLNSGYEVLFVPQG